MSFEQQEAKYSYLQKPKIPANHFIETLIANVHNSKLSDKDFREFVKATLPIVERTKI